jgi:predicted nucleic acid-binding protein
MNAVDTNVLIYVHDDREPEKKALARELIDRLEEGLLIWQVACEYLAAARKLAPQGYTPHDARQDVDDLRHLWTTTLPSWRVFDRSTGLTERYSLSSWDALLVAACLEANVVTLYTEDFSGYATIDGLTIVNPFAQAAQSSD